MKRALKITIIIVVILALLFGAAKLFITADFLVGQAQSLVEDGRYSRAITYLGWAWDMEPDRDDIPIILADTYAASGNYTKAEFTLVNAISAKPQMTELYVALCRIYVEQEKFLDAVQMFDHITDPTVKEDLDSMRPAAPEVSPDGGYYNEYIEVDVKDDGDTIYVTFSGEYPASKEDLYSGPVTLPGGETTVRAIAVNEKGLVSPMTLNGYTVGGVVEEVVLTDPAIDQTVREQLGLSSDAALMSDLLWSITHLELPDTVHDLNDLSRFTGLRSLTLNNVSGMDFTILAQTPSLKELDLSGCTISSNSLETIGSLTELEKLVLNGCALTDISPLAQLVKLKQLCLSNNILEDIGVLSLMTHLESVELSNNPLSSIAALSACEQLKYLDISNCTVNSLGSLSSKAQLETLIASNNKIKSITELAQCGSLSVLQINNNTVSDISVLPGLAALTRFEADHNEITEIPQFDGDSCQLIYFSINYNQVSDVSGFAGVHTLNYLNIDYNKVTDLLPIAENSNLVKVNAWDNAITVESVNKFNEYCIILNYNPNYKAPEE